MKIETYFNYDEFKHYARIEFDGWEQLELKERLKTRVEDILNDLNKFSPKGDCKIDFSEAGGKA